MFNNISWIFSPAYLLRLEQSFKLTVPVDILQSSLTTLGEYWSSFSLVPSLILQIVTSVEGEGRSTHLIKTSIVSEKPMLLYFLKNQFNCNKNHRSLFCFIWIPLYFRTTNLEFSGARDYVKSHSSSLQKHAEIKKNIDSCHRM